MLIIGQGTQQEPFGDARAPREGLPRKKEVMTLEVNPESFADALSR
jgi:hypothetical protein